jgi:hypothetical protein
MDEQLNHVSLMNAKIATFYIHACNLSVPIFFHAVDKRFRSAAGDDGRLFTQKCVSIPPKVACVLSACSISDASNGNVVFEATSQFVARRHDPLKLIGALEKLH